jgi:hypothetical protein
MVEIPCKHRQACESPCPNKRPEALYSIYELVGIINHVINEFNLPLLTKLRWVNMTPFALPVVPLE